MTPQDVDNPEIRDNVPLVIDVDGTLLRTDLLYETFWAALGHDVLATLLVFLRCWSSPPQLKAELRRIAEPEIELVPVRDYILDLALEAIATGRQVHLASGSDQGLVDAVARRFGLEGEHFGTHADRNLTDATKAAFLYAKFGPQGYDYAGNSWADLKSWKNARQIIAVSPGARLSARLERLGSPVRIIRDGWSISALLRELRPLQWTKNLLLFLPLLGAQDIQPASVFAILLAVIAFSMGASAIYILNDMLDLEADRMHPEKRNRPIAAGTLPIRAAMAASTLLVVMALTLAFLVSPGVAGLTFLYMLSSLTYSLWLKKLRWVDVITLACLFLLRVLTGVVASGLIVSLWVLGFVFAVFFTLACVKRMTALSRAFKGGKLPGRGYSFEDLGNLEKAAFASISLAAILFIAHAFSPAVAGQYSSPSMLALAVLPIMLWLFRIVRLSKAGIEHYDPIRFVFHDKIGLALAAIGLAIVFLTK